MVAMYQVTANVVRVKLGWGFAMSRTFPADSEVARVHTDVQDRCDRLLGRAQEAGVLREDLDLDWARRVYYALIHEATYSATPDEDTDALATLVVDTLPRGLGGSGRL